MGVIRTCYECGRTYESGKGASRSDGYCSEGCRRKAKAAGGGAPPGVLQGGGSSSSGSSKGGTDSLLTVLKLVGIVFVALTVVFTVLCYKFPKFLKEKNKKLLYAYIIAWVVLIAGTVVYFSFFSREAVSGIKIKVVSVSCQTEEKFVSLVKEALSEVSVTIIQDDDFAKYSQQARDAVKERNKYDTLKDSVYFVKLPDNVNVYIWFETKDSPKAIVYKTNKKK